MCTKYTHVLYIVYMTYYIISIINKFALSILVYIIYLYSEHRWQLTVKSACCKMMININLVLCPVQEKGRIIYFLFIIEATLICWVIKHLAWKCGVTQPAVPMQV